jgi:hypothetical protein
LQCETVDASAQTERAECARFAKNGASRILGFEVPIQVERSVI